MVKQKTKNLEKKVSFREDLNQKLFLNYFDTTKYRAIIYNSNGEQVAVVKLDRTEETFSYKDNSYIIKWDYKSFFIRKDFFSKYKYFHYSIGNPEPISFPNIEKPKFDAKLFNQLLKTKVVKDLNNVNNSLKELLTPKNIMIGLAIIVALYYFANGGTLA